jgi:hypothetical protein
MHMKNQNKTAGLQDCSFRYIHVIHQKKLKKPHWGDSHMKVFFFWQLCFCCLKMPCLAGISKWDGILLSSGLLLLHALALPLIGWLGKYFLILSLKEELFFDCYKIEKFRTLSAETIKLYFLQILLPQAALQIHLQGNKMTQSVQIPRQQAKLIIQVKLFSKKWNGPQSVLFWFVTILFMPKLFRNKQYISQKSNL